MAGLLLVLMGYWLSTGHRLLQPVLYISIWTYDFKPLNIHNGNALKLIKPGVVRCKGKAAIPPKFGGGKMHTLRLTYACPAKCGTYFSGAANSMLAKFR